MQQIGGAGPLVQPLPLTRLLRRPPDPRPPHRPPDGRVRMAGLAGDQPRPPAAAPPGRPDPRSRSQPSRGTSPRRVAKRCEMAATLWQDRAVTVDEYIAAADPDRREALRALRDVIRD